jgi:hypothetical protein
VHTDNRFTVNQRVRVRIGVAVYVYVPCEVWIRTRSRIRSTVECEVRTVVRSKVEANIQSRVQSGSRTKIHRKEIGVVIFMCAMQEVGQDSVKGLVHGRVRGPDSRPVQGRGHTLVQGPVREPDGVILHV